MINVHLLRSPDYSANDYFDLCSLLKALNLPVWRFVVTEEEINDWDIEDDEDEKDRVIRVMACYSHNAFSLFKKESKPPEPLSWQEQFRICDRHRKKAKVPPNDLVVLLSQRPNNLNWFAAADQKKNIFVHTDEWNRFIPSEPKYPIAYMVLANALRQQLDFETTKMDSYLHPVSIGCMNDFCQSKSEVALKLRTGDICADCLEDFRAKEVPWVVVQAALDGFDKLRRQMLFTNGFMQKRQSNVLLINQHFQLLFPEQGNLEVKVPTLAKALYLFFLQQPQGLRLAELSNHRDQLMKIYQQISRSSDIQRVRRAIDRLIDPLENSLYENLSRIHRSIQTTLGPTLGEPFLIKGEAGSPYRIGLEALEVQWETPAGCFAARQ
jgi:hypothetical protein